MIRDAISRIVDGQDLTGDEAATAMEEIMENRATPSQISSFITALRMKGESVDEIYGCASVMRRMATSFRGAPGAIDTCGTGGDGLDTFNISTTAAFIAAGAGVNVAKHGNRSVSSRSGSADLLEALGMKIDLPAARVEECMEHVGMGFLFAPTFHRAMRYAIGPRRDIGIRTVFNILGPLTNPAGVDRQLLGVYDPALTETLANVLRKFGHERALVVNGGGMDELTTLGPTKISELREGKVVTYTLEPEEVGLSRSAPGDIRGEGPEGNARKTLAILEGKQAPGTDIALLNAGAAIYVAGQAENIREGVDAARVSVSTGRAMKKLDELVEFTNALGGGKE